MANFKPTFKEPVSPQSIEFEKDFKKTMVQNGLHDIREVDGMLNEKEQSLKKKIFSLAKMESLVFSDPKLSAVYENMAENGEEKYGYHYNETIMNMIFNDYVLNSPKYLQKYKMSIPKEKKRRDKSGINQLKKAGAKKMDATGTKIEKSKNKTNEIEIEETTTAGSAGGSAGYVGYAGPAAFSSQGDLSGDFKGKKKETDPKAKPISTGFALHETNYLTDSSGFEKYVNRLNESTYDEAVAQAKQISYEEGVAQHVNQVNNNNYVVSDWFDTDKTVISFENGRQLNEESDSSFISQHGSNTYGSVDNMSPENKKIIKKDIQTGKMDSNHNIKDGIALQEKTIPQNPNNHGFTKFDDYVADVWNILEDKYKMSNEEAINLLSSQESLIKKRFDNYVAPESIAYELFVHHGKLNEKAKSKSQQRFMGMVHAVQKGELSPDEVGGSVAKAADSMSDKDAEDFASTKHKGLPDQVNESLQNTVEYISDRQGEEPFELHGNKWQFVNAKYPDGKIDIGVYRFGHDLVYDYNWWRNEMGINENTKYLEKKGEIPQRGKLAFSDKKIKEETQTMIGDNGTSMSNKSQATGDLSSEVPMGTQDSGGLNESEFKLLEEINNELEAFSIHHDKLKLMAENKKTPSMVQGDRLRSENPKNFKKDLQHSGTKDIINVEKELQWKDQQTDVPNDPQKLGNDIEKNEIKAAKMKSGDALKNVGNSTNNEGDEIPKRNLTTKEQEEVNLYRNGQHSIVYDNEPDERFLERQKADQGEFFEMGEKQKEFKAGAPLYNKEEQPISDTEVEKDQFDKNVKPKGSQTPWNERMGLGSNIKLAESMVTGRYINALGKRKLIEFKLNDVNLVESVDDDAMKLSFDGLGNTYMSRTVDKKVVVNEVAVKAIDSHQFYTDGTAIYAIPNPVKNINESENKQKPVINEQQEKMKHLLGYKPSSFVNTNNVKKNRGF